MFHISYGTHTANQQKILSNYVSVNEQSGIIAGNGGFYIKVDGNTDLKGGAILSAAPKEWNILDTTSLTYSDIQNYAEYKASSSSVGVSSSSLSNNITRNLLSQAPQALNGGEEATSTTYATLSPSIVTIAGATATDEQLKGLKTAQIDSRIIPIFDKQEVLDDMALASTVSDIVTLGSSVIATELKRDDYINRDTAIAQAEADLWVDSYLYGDGSAYEAYAQNPNVTALLSNEYLNSLYISDEDKKVFRSMLPQDQAQLLQDMVNKGESFGALSSQEASWHTTQLNYGPGSSFDMATQAIRGALSALAIGNSSGAAANLTQPYIANEIGNYFDDPQNTNETARLLAHAALGAASAYISGNDATSGALGAASGEAIAILVRKELYGDKSSNEPTQQEKETIRAVATLASGLVGAMSGGSFEDSATAAAAGYNAAVNNYLSPKQKEQKAIAETKCNQGNIEACGEVIKWNKLDKEQSFAGVFGSDIWIGIKGLADGLRKINNLDTSKMSPAEQGLFQYLVLGKERVLSETETPINLIDLIQNYNDAVDAYNKINNMKDEKNEK